MSYIPLFYRIRLGESHLLPLCDVYLIGRTSLTHVEALVDSGAVFPIFPKWAAEEAGIDLESCPPQAITYGAGATIGRKARTHVQINGYRMSFDIVFVERLDLPYALLGRRTFFAQFREIAFIEKLDVPQVHLRW